MRATDTGIFLCPFLFASDVGTIEFLPDEVTALRDYLRKGGFLWVDDFWGQVAFDRWSSEIARVLPGLPIVKLATGWEREGENQEFFERFSAQGYAVGINTVIWNLTH